MNYTIDEIRAAWLAAALDEWGRVVRDDDGGHEGNRADITRYFETCGWSFHLARFGGTYREHPTTSWCGIFAGAMGRRLGDYLEPDRCVGLMLDADVAKYCTPSTERLASPAKWAAANEAMPRIFFGTGEGILRDKATRHIVKPEDVLLPGVLMTVKTSGNKPNVGDHIVLVEKYDPASKTVYTVEGNGRGLLGDGKRGEGVVRVERALRDIRRIYHLDYSHFETMERTPWANV